MEILDSGYTKRRIGNCSIRSFSKEPASTDTIAKVRTGTASPLTMYLKKLKLICDLETVITPPDKKVKDARVWRAPRTHKKNLLANLKLALN